MSTLIPELERELEAMVARQCAVAPIATPPARPPARRRRRLSRRAAIVLAAVLLLAATAALAATGVIPIGTPVTDPPGAPEPRPDVGLGTVVHGTAKVLSLRVEDPGGGPPWGVRLSATTRGIGCLHVGRVVGGRLGALGMDDAFDNDGRFHPLPTDLQSDLGSCAQLDAADQLFTSTRIGAIPAAGIWNGACYPPHEVTGDPTAKTCPAADMRQVSVGALGPRLRSITYTGDDGRPHVQQAAPPYGAFLIVRRRDPRDGDFGMSGGGGLMVEPPITKVTWADGRSCAVTVRGLAPACPIPGYKPRPVPHLTTADVRSPVRARVERRPGRGRVLVVRFRARVAVTDGSSTYTVTRRLRGAHTWGSAMTQRDIRAGEVVEQVFYGPPRHGLYRGAVTYTSGGPTSFAYGTGAPARPPVRLLVGHYTLRVP